MTARVLPTAFVLVLLAATAGAFALTEGAKLERSPLYATQPSQVFSPDSVVPRTRFAEIHFRVRRAERIDVWIVDAKKRTVATLVSNRSVHARQRVSVLWDAFTSGGITVPDGVYYPVVKLTRSHRTIVIPSKIELDTKAPRITVRPRTKYPIISPDGDGHGDLVRVPYRVDEAAHGILFVRGKQVAYTRSRKSTGELVWSGKQRAGGVFKPLRPGRYVLEVAARDTAGNQSKPVPFAIGQVRYVVLARSRVVARAGGRFAIRVSTDAPRVDWSLHGRSGTLPRGTLHLRAPRSAGVYHLYVTVGSHSAGCTVVVA